MPTIFQTTILLNERGIVVGVPFAEVRVAEDIGSKGLGSLNRHKIISMKRVYDPSSALNLRHLFDGVIDRNRANCCIDPLIREFRHHREKQPWRCQGSSGVVDHNDLDVILYEGESGSNRR